ncbi:RecJ-like exonuclease [Methanobrevibacter gottschalkii]|uniref:RecJ-like exonuclease n=2 Tax=Methanobrevibacter gottschalkii TaxID=190974 RepID=A0A3N5B6R4_9EURY|nr:MULTISPECIES: DHH family phosphoesterase [Methanobrevibacter]MCQ2970838.1 DHH family phosphoesterase [archaeon]OEC96399.1 phosphoesterase [Methanobrevibacter sp. A27]RPF52779.1 RecJ-like exonuclease [Methanobrevibacter gottschalkii DSM 11977]SEK22299.1 RecJ-like exonuclease [Methanobrevibacter gottschalkii]
MLNRASEATDMLKEHIENDDVIRIISHNDADGISSAAVLANALAEEDVQFHTTIIPRLKGDIVNQLRHEKYDLFIFSDMGSPFIKEFNTYKHDVIVADHHQVNDTEAESNVVHLNPHLFGIDGSKDLCGAGSSYLTIRGLDKKHLAYFALIGAFGDMQGQNGFTGVNKLIVDDAIESGTLEIHEGLKIVSKSSEPIFKSLAYTFSPPLPKISGDFEGAREFLERMNLSYGIKFTDLEDEEKDLLKEALMSINPDIFGDCYTVPKEVPLLRDLEEYSYILDACGKNKKQGLGLSIALGERDQALDTALKLQSQYRDQIVKGLEWIKKQGAEQLNSIQYLYSEDKVLKSVMGTIASIGLSVELLDDSKPVIGLSRLHKDIKISGRTTRNMVAKGVNLGKALQDSSNNFGGTGGGHDIAAGAMVAYEFKDKFLHLVDEMVEYQLTND